jgi:hypothetical protein
MRNNYTLYAYDDKWNCVQEWFFENVTIIQKDNTISVLDATGKIIYMISTSRCTVVIMEDDE